MCGIFGIVDPSGGRIAAPESRRALASLAHRGPDDEGWWQDGVAALGHRRLSIMDLSEAGHEPLGNEDGSVQVVFNGEIYGFGALRQELEALGHLFRSECDAEVLVHGWEAWGRGLLDRIDGMFAFGLWDARERKLLLARDRLGKKPLFIARRGSALGFASGLRPLVEAGLVEPQMDARALREFLFFNYVPGPRTILSGVELLPAGGWLEWHRGREQRGRYWRLADAEPLAEPAVAEERFEARLCEATRLRLVSDAPLGVFLSGGVDSAVVAALAQRESGRALESFTVGFEDPGWDERPKARRVAAALGTRHEEVVCGPEEVPEAFRRLAASADHLLADQSMIPLTLLAGRARESVKVVLTGDGGDELLAGYATYRALDYARLWTAVAPRGVRLVAAHWGGRLGSGGKMTPGMLAARFLSATTDDVASAHARWRAIRTPAEISALVGELGASAPEWSEYAAALAARPGWSWLQRAVHADVSYWLVDSVLAKVDRATMACGLEARSPLLDARLFELSFGTLLRDPRNRGKAPLRRLAGRLLGPELAQVPKEGFQTPWSTWLRGPLRPWLRATLDDLDARLGAVIAGSAVRAAEEQHASGQRDHGLALFGLAALAEWSRLFPGLRAGESE